MNKPFNKKQIEQILSSKMDEWMNTISDNLLRDNIKNHYIITGGAIVSLLLGEEPNDYDVYFDNVLICTNVVEYYYKNLVVAEKFLNTETNSDWIVNGRVRPTGNGYVDIAQNEDDDAIDTLRGKPKIHYENLFHSHNDEFYGNNVKNHSAEKVNGKKYYLPKLVTSNSITLSNDVQIITRICGSPMRIHKTFDFVHCVSYYTPETGLVLNRFALESILTKELKYLGGPYPITTLFRMKKFLDRGWTISYGEMLKIITDVMKIEKTKNALSLHMQNGLNSPWKDFIDELPDDLTSLTQKEMFDIINKTVG